MQQIQVTASHTRQPATQPPFSTPAPSTTPIVVAPTVRHAARGLHPNLAKVAARYSPIVQSYAAGDISPATARSMIRRLVARDDQGALWMLREDGCWYRRSVDGVWAQDVPPTYGVEVPSPFDVSLRPGFGQVDMSQTDPIIDVGENIDRPLHLQADTSTAPVHNLGLRTKLMVAASVLIGTSSALLVLLH